MGNREENKEGSGENDPKDVSYLDSRVSTAGLRRGPPLFLGQRISSTVFILLSAPFFLPQNNTITSA